MIAHALASNHPHRVRSVAWGECPLPGTNAFDVIAHDPAVFHFALHQQADLPEMLVAGKEREYIEHFYARLSHNPSAIADADLEHYARKFAQAGALRCGFDTYRTFERDARANREVLQKEGKCKVPCLALVGRESPWFETAEKQAKEVYGSVEVEAVAGSGHWCAEENPEGFVEGVLRFVGKHNG